MMKKAKVLFSLLLALAMLCTVLTGCGDTASDSGTAQGNGGGIGDYPSGPISGISPWTAGGSSDITFRTYLQYLSEELGVDINVQNVTGGDGSIAMNQVLSAAPDGYTMTMLNYDILSNEAKGITPETYRDFQIINMFTQQAVVFIVNEDSGWETFDDFVQAALDARAEGRTLQIGINGFWLHAAGLACEAAGISDAVVFVPSNGSSELVTELLGKHCDAVTASMTVFLPHIQDGTVKVLGVMDYERMEAFPDIPTFVEQGYDDVIMSGFRMLAVHKDTPPEIVEYLREAGKKAFENPDFLQWAEEASADPTYMTAEECIQYLEQLYPVVEDSMRQLDLI